MSGTSGRGSGNKAVPSVHLRFLSAVQFFAGSVVSTTKTLASSGSQLGFLFCHVEPGCTWEM